MIENTYRLRVSLGILTIILGIALGLGVAYHAYTLIHGVETIPVIAQMIPPPGERVISTPKGIIEVPERFFKAIGYFIVIFLLSLILKVAVVFLRFGVRMLNSDLKQLVQELQRQSCDKRFTEDILNKFVQHGERHWTILNKFGILA